MPRAKTAERSRPMKRTRNGILIPDVPIMAGGNLPNAVKGVSAGGGINKYVLQSIMPNLPNYNPAACIIFEQNGFGEYVNVNDKTKGWFMTLTTASEFTAFNRIFRNKNNVADTNGIVGVVGQNYSLTNLDFLRHFVGLQTISQYDFSGCELIESVIFPNTLKRIESNSFTNDTALKSVQFNEGLEYIENNAFIGCVALTSVNLPQSLLQTDSDCFSGMAELNVMVNGETSFHTTGNSNGLNGSVVNVVISYGVEKIPTNAYTWCLNLAACIIPSSVKILESASFRSMGLPLLDLPESITNIGSKVITNNTNLETLIVRAITPPQLSGDAISGNTLLSAIKVPANSVDAYKSAPNWSSFANIITSI